MAIHSHLGIFWADRDGLCLICGRFQLFLAYFYPNDLRTPLRSRNTVKYFWNLSPEIFLKFCEIFQRVPLYARKGRQSKCFVSIVYFLESVATARAGVLSQNNTFSLSVQRSECARDKHMRTKFLAFLVSCTDIGLFACKSKDTRLWMPIFPPRQILCHTIENSLPPAHSNIVRRHVISVSTYYDWHPFLAYYPT